MANNDDEVKALTLEMSQGGVDGFDPIGASSQTADGLFRVKLKVRVRRGDVHERVKKTTFGFKVSGKDLWADAITRAKSMEDGGG